MDFSVLVFRKDIPLTGQHRHIYGVLGTIRLIAGNYLIVLTGRRKVGSINGQSIWLVTGTEMIPYPKTLLHLTEKQVNCENGVFVVVLM